MYKQFFGLREEPFNMTPDPQFMYFSKKHMELISSLHYGVQWRKGFIEVTGEIGAGKTTVCRMFLDNIRDKARTALILNPCLSEIQLLQTICEDFGLEAKTSNKKILFDRINAFLLDVLQDGMQAVLIIDEAQNLSPKALEQIRLISNLETDKHKLIQIILVGQPELRDLLKKPQLRQLRQRISVRYHLTALNYTETDEYIMHRLAKAGAPANAITFSPQAVKAIFDYSKGVPRMVNVLCDKILLAAFVRETRQITNQIALQAIKEVEGDIAPESFEALDTEKTFSMPTEEVSEEELAQLQKDI
jgi:general secretion pathway protein A